MTRCCVLKCSEIGVHHFPKDVKILKLWLKAIRRQKFEPKETSRLCRLHFNENDYTNVSEYTGVKHQRRYLKKTAVPSIFTWNTKKLTEAAKAREERIRARTSRKELFPGPSSSSKECDILPLSESTQISHEVEITMKENDDSTLSERKPEEKVCNTSSTQTSNILRLFSTELLYVDNEAVNFYTGLESYAKLSLVLSTLLPMANELEYRWSRVIGLSVEDQFVMLLMKLRRNKPDFELSRMFGVSKTQVSNILVTWINFVSDLWNLIDIWPSRELVNYYMPECFRNQFHSTRVIIDGTEIPIQKPSQPDSQKVTFSSYKHKNTIKFLVGASPGGLLTYCSGAYGGSASDRQIVERSNLLQLCGEGDSIMADRCSRFICP
ncbi:uncharacterized protein LOC125225168 [Leguminivora glycinivorella]|uniref:uncharacterized protein LOC125225168 n=1 Tax=Leguminivora glycinivorella TaxID=1035111 RepID=UPI00200FAE35|nr:uncharacterized protein LOC125225168 [Leguminivora glycinivorella]